MKKYESPNRIAFRHMISTDGCGYWNRRAAAVQTISCELFFCNEEKEFGELRMYFDTRTWSVDDHGLIYGDNQFDQQARECLQRHGLDASDCGYSESGMQGNDYVSFDVGSKFIESWMAAETADAGFLEQ